MKKYLFILFCLCLYVVLHGQIDTSSLYMTAGENEDLERRIEDIFTMDDDEPDCSELVESMMYYSTHKININAPDYEALSELGASDWQLYELQKYLTQYGSMYTLYELVAVPGWNVAMVQQLQPYIVVAPVPAGQKVSWKNLLKHGKHKLLLRYGQVAEPQAAYAADSGSAPAYTGSPQAYMLKYVFTCGDKLQCGLTAEKDAGEPFFRGKNKQGFDFYSMHLYAKNIGLIKSAACGSYQISYGQGLAMNMGFAATQPQNSVNMSRQSRLLKPYASANENNYLHGVAAVINAKVADVLVFYSLRKADAVTEGDSVGGYYVSSLKQTGYHRTITEAETKCTLHEHVAGMYLQMNRRVLHVGAGCYYTAYSLPWNRDLPLYNTYAFNSSWNVNASMDYKLLWHHTSLYGEVAMSANAAVALLQGCTFYIHPRFTLSVLYRYYSPQYQCLHAGAYGAGSGNANEQGCYVGFNLLMGKHFTCNAGVDYYAFPWLKYRVDAPSDGWTASCRLRYDLNRYFFADISIKYKTAALNYTADSYNAIYQYNKQQYRAQCTWSPLSWLLLKTILQMVNYRPSPMDAYRQGYWVSEDVKLNFESIGLSIAGRVALFDTYSYDERIGVYEYDVLYAFSVPMVYGKGERLCMVLHYKPCKQVDIWAKAGQTYFRNRSHIGSGATAIEGQHKTDVKLQLQLKW